MKQALYELFGAIFGLATITPLLFVSTVISYNELNGSVWMLISVIATAAICSGIVISSMNTFKRLA